LAVIVVIITHRPARPLLEEGLAESHIKDSDRLEDLSARLGFVSFASHRLDDAAQEAIAENAVDVVLAGVEGEAAAEHVADDVIGRERRLCVVEFKNVAKDGRLLLDRSFGWSDRNATRPLAPRDPLRLASLSQLFTGALTHKLIESGKLRIDESAVEILNLKPPPGHTMDPRWRRVTIAHLWARRGGWDRSIAGEPMDRSLEIAVALGHAAPADSVQFMAGESLKFDPGSKEVYSNIGYCVLGRVVEKIAARRYGDALRHLVLEPLGIRGVELARSLPEDRNPHEPEYIHPFKSRNLFSCDSTAMANEPDGGFCFEA
jgi:hypothetical protein